MHWWLHTPAAAGDRVTSQFALQRRQVQVMRRQVRNNGFSFSPCLSSSHSYNSSIPLNLTASSVRTRISSNAIHTHSFKPENRPQNFTMSEVFVVEKCDIFTGSWVHDLLYPLYDSRTCPYLNGEATCQRNGDGSPVTSASGWSSKRTAGVTV